jgi:Kef-type K+ transport system membrane component KefB
MQGLDTFSLIIAASGVIILSYFFNILSKKTNIPSVLMLIALGVIAKIVTGWDGTKFMSILEVLGNVGLIMIVLEAALDLQLKKEKWPIIWKSFAVALLGLIGSTFFIAMVLSFFLELDTKLSVIYAVPLGIMSSAIIIPSVAGLIEEKREFMIYESTFSDILGIMLFYFILGNHDNTNTQSIVFDVTSNIAVTIILSIVLSYALVFVFQKIKTQVKLFLLISILTLLYAVGKKFHLSSLVIVLIFGLVLNNHHLFFRGFLKKYIDVPSVTEILHNFHLITAESAFVVRTFFFVIFGISISLVSLLSVEFAVVSAFIVLGIYIVRFGVLKVFKPKSFSPEVYIAPRGLITILLFYAIPEELRSDRFDESILLFTILATSLFMTFALIRNAKNQSESSEEELLSSDSGEDTLTENHTKEI